MSNHPSLLSPESHTFLFFCFLGAYTEGKERRKEKELGARTNRY
jgi:hypothetical protein